MNSNITTSLMKAIADMNQTVILLFVDILIILLYKKQRTFIVSKLIYCSRNEHKNKNLIYQNEYEQSKHHIK